MSAALRVWDLWKSYAAGVRGCSARVWVLRGCSLAVDAGERVAIVGRPCAGKTTLLHCIAGVLRPDAGRIHRHATSVHVAPTHAGRFAPPPASDALILLDSGHLDLLAQLVLEAPNATMLVSARDVAAVQRLVHRVVVLHEGRLHEHRRTVVRRVAEQQPIASAPLTVETADV